MSHQGRGAKETEFEAGEGPFSIHGLPPLDAAARPDSRKRGCSVPSLARPSILQRRGSELPELTTLSDAERDSPRLPESPSSNPSAIGDDSVSCLGSIPWDSPTLAPFCLQGRRDSLTMVPGCLKSHRDSLTMIPSCLKGRRASVEEDSGTRPPRVHKTVSMPAVGTAASEEDPCTSPAGLPRLRKTKTMGDEMERSWRRNPQAKRVAFPLCCLSSTHDVTPYAEKYGVHPSFFEFDRNGEKRLTDSGIVEDVRRTEKGLSPLKLNRKH